MAGPTTESLAEDTKGLVAAIGGLRADFAALKAVSEKEFSDAKAFEKWIKNILIAVVVSAGGVIWAASALHSKVDQQGVRLDKLEAKVDRLEQKVDQGFGQVNQQLGAILQRLDQVVPKPKGGP